MALQPAVLPPAVERDPIADARALVAMAVNLGTRARQAHRLGQVTDRKASLYVNTLVRHAARLLQSTHTHDVPVLHASSLGPGGNSVHYVVRHDQLEGPPMGQRFVTVGSDARLRCCVVSAIDGSRIWADYDVSSAPEDLSLRVVLDALSELINRLEQAVTRLEAKQIVREAQLEADIARAKARLSGMTAEGTGPKRHATSEEPLRPWTRHVPGVVSVAPVPVVPVPVVPVPVPPVPVPPVPVSPVPVAPVPTETAVASTAETPPPEPTVMTDPALATTPTPHETLAPDGRPRRGFKLSRLENAI